jgi:hypothetical protein
MQSKKIIQAGLCLVITTILALTSHIYISEWVKPVLDSMTQGLHDEPYSFFIISAAYGTAFITCGVVVFLYYHSQHLLPIKSNLLKALLIACILLEVKGNLIRQPVMDVLVNYSFGMQGFQPFVFVGLNTLDKWISALLSALALVYLCPRKYETVKS